MALSVLDIIIITLFLYCQHLFLASCPQLSSQMNLLYNLSSGFHVLLRMLSYVDMSDTRAVPLACPPSRPPGKRPFLFQNQE